jgi:Ca2+-binding EF-hand superfamily protein
VSILSGLIDVDPADRQRPRRRQGKKNGQGAKPTNVTITEVDPKNGSITVKCTDEKGQTQERTFQLTSNIRILDETGRVAHIDLFESGNEALIVESEGRLQEIRRVPSRGGSRRLSDTVRTFIEMTECDEGCAEDLQKIYDMLRKLDTGKNGKIDLQALRAEADHILRERVKATFDRLDSNKDGKISKQEARASSRSISTRLTRTRMASSTSTSF